VKGLVGEERKVAAILVADIVGFSRLTGADEEATLARLRALRADLFNPSVAAHGGRVVKRTGDGAIVEFRSVVEAVRCALDVTKGLAERNAGLAPDQRIEVRTGIHLGDVIEEADGDLMGDGVNIAARLEGISAPGGVCLSEDAWRQVRDKIPETFVDLGEQELKNIARPMRVFALGGQALARPAAPPEEPAVVAPPQRESGPVRALAAAGVGVLDSVARLIGVFADKAATAGSPAIRSAGDVPSVESIRARGRRLRRAIRSAIRDIPSPEARARDRRLRRAIIVAAVLSLLAARACHERRRAAPAPPPRVGAVEERLTQARSPFAGF
jgi:class 3 adenylate cyclase